MCDTAAIHLYLHRTAVHLSTYLRTLKKKKSKIKYSWKQKLYDLAGKSFMIWQPKVNKIKRLLPGCKKEKRAMFVVSDILNTTSYCILSKCLSLQPTALEVRTKRPSLNCTAG